MKKTLLILLSAQLFWAESSMFKAVDIETKKVNGLNQTEQYIYNNKISIDDLKNRLLKLELSGSSLSTSTEGMQTILRGNSEKINELSKKIFSIEEKITILEEFTKSIDFQLLSFKEQMDGIENNISFANNNLKSVFETQNKNDQKYINSINQISQTITQLDLLFVKEEKLKEFAQKIVEQIDINKNEITVLKKNLDFLKDSGKLDKQIYGKIEPSELLTNAANLIEKKDYKEARNILEYLLNKKADFERAKVLFYIGEAEYQLGNFEDAIDAFKASGAKDESANHMNILLFHTGVAYEKLKKNEDAKKYYKLLMDLFPDNYLTKSAKARFEKL